MGMDFVNPLGSEDCAAVAEAAAAAAAMAMVVNEQPASIVTFDPLPPNLPRRAASICPKLPSYRRVTDASFRSWFVDKNANFPRIQLHYVRECGRGWFGKVVEGEARGILDGENGRRRVIVRILKEDATCLEQATFLDEALPYGQLKHPHILKLLGRCLEDAPFLLIFEACSNDDLKSYLKFNAGNKDALISHGIMLRMALDAAAGLQYMMENGYVHPDVASRNCCVTGDLRVKIGDYGASLHNYKDEYYVMGETALPIRWSAPETIACLNNVVTPKQINSASCVWSYGVFLWELEHWGELPYRDLSNEQVISRVFGIEALRLKCVARKTPYTAEIYEIMRACWRNEGSRPSLTEIAAAVAALSKKFKTIASSPWSTYQTASATASSRSVSECYSEYASASKQHRSPSMENLRGSLDNVANSVNALVPDFRLGPAWEDSKPLFPQTGEEGASMSSCSLRGKRDSVTEAEDEMWRDRIERGEFTAKVKEKSKSVADLMILTHIDSESSEESMPSYTAAGIFGSRQSSLRKASGGVGRNGSLLNSLSFGSDNNIPEADAGFQEALAKMRTARMNNDLESFMSLRSNVEGEWDWKEGYGRQKRLWERQQQQHQQLQQHQQPNMSAAVQSSPSSRDFLVGASSQTITGGVLGSASNFLADSAGYASDSVTLGPSEKDTLEFFKGLKTILVDCSLAEVDLIGVEEDTAVGMEEGRRVPRSDTPPPAACKPTSSREEDCDCCFDCQGRASNFQSDDSGRGTEQINSVDGGSDKSMDDGSISVQMNEVKSRLEEVAAHHDECDSDSLPSLEEEECNAEEAYLEEENKLVRVVEITELTDDEGGEGSCNLTYNVSDIADGLAEGGGGDSDAESDCYPREWLPSPLGSDDDDEGGKGEEGVGFGSFLTAEFAEAIRKELREKLPQCALVSEREEEQEARQDVAVEYNTSYASRLSPILEEDEESFTSTSISFVTERKLNETYDVTDISANSYSPDSISPEEAAHLSSYASSECEILSDIFLSPSKSAGDDVWLETPKEEWFFLPCRQQGDLVRIPSPEAISTGDSSWREEGAEDTLTNNSEGFSDADGSEDLEAAMKETEVGIDADEDGPSASPIGNAAVADGNYSGAIGVCSHLIGKFDDDAANVDPGQFADQVGKRVNMIEKSPGAYVKSSYPIEKSANSYVKPAEAAKVAAADIDIAVTTPADGGKSSNGNNDEGNGWSGGRRRDSKNSPSPESYVTEEERRQLEAITKNSAALFGGSSKRRIRTFQVSRVSESELQRKTGRGSRGEEEVTLMGREEGRLCPSSWGSLDEKRWKALSGAATTSSFSSSSSIAFSKSTNLKHFLSAENLRNFGIEELRVADDDGEMRTAFGMEDAVEHREQGYEDDSSDDDDDDDEDLPEFVPSYWDSSAEPQKSALKSPENFLEKSGKKVSFKKQKYHCVYEYPKEPIYVNLDDDQRMTINSLWEYKTPSYHQFPNYEHDNCADCVSGAAGNLTIFNMDDFNFDTRCAIATTEDFSLGSDSSGDVSSSTSSSSSSSSSSSTSTIAAVRKMLEEPSSPPHPPVILNKTGKEASSSRNYAAAATVVETISRAKMNASAHATATEAAVAAAEEETTMGELRHAKNRLKLDLKNNLNADYGAAAVAATTITARSVSNRVTTPTEVLASTGFA